MQLLERLAERLFDIPGAQEDRRRISELKGDFRDSIETLLNGWGSISFNTKVDWTSHPSEWTSSKDFPSVVEVRASMHRLGSQYSFSIAAQSHPLLEFRLRRGTFTVLKENRPVTIVEDCMPVDKLEAEIDWLQGALKVVRLVTEARQTSSQIT